MAQDTSVPSHSMVIGTNCSPLRSGQMGSSFTTTGRRRRSTLMYPFPMHAEKLGAEKLHLWTSPGRFVSGIEPAAAGLAGLFDPFRSEKPAKSTTAPKSKRLPAIRDTTARLHSTDGCVHDPSSIQFCVPSGLSLSCDALPDVCRTCSTSLRCACDDNSIPIPFTGFADRLRSPDCCAANTYRHRFPWRNVVNPYAPPVPEPNSVPIIPSENNGAWYHAVFALTAVAASEAFMQRHFGWMVWVLLPISLIYPLKLYASTRYRHSFWKSAGIYCSWCVMAVAIVICQQAPIDWLMPSLYFEVAVFLLPIATISWLWDTASRTNRSLPFLIWRSVIEVAIMLPAWCEWSQHHLIPVLENFLQSWAVPNAVKRF